MKSKISKKLRRTGWLVLPALIMLQLVMAAPQAAAVTLFDVGGSTFDPNIDQHIDRSTILYNGKYYFDSKIDDNYVYFQQGSGAQCDSDHVNSIHELRNGDKTATLFTYTKDKATGDCSEKKTTVQLAHPERSYMPFDFINSDTIITSDKKNTYKKTTYQGEQVYLEQGGDQCKDIIKVQSGPDASGAKISVLASTGGNNTSYDDWSNQVSFNKNKMGFRGDCTTYGPNSYPASTVYLTNQKQLDNSPVADAGSSSSSGDSGPTCGSDNSSLSWIICPVFNGIADAADGISGIINSLLDINTTQIFGDTCPSSGGSCKAYHTAWSSMRNIALLIIIIAGLIMVIAQAAGSQAIDAYTVRSVLPRLLIAAIGISLSWIIMQFLVEFSNVLGEGIRTLIYAPFNGLDSSTHGTGGNVGSVLGGVSAGALLGVGAFALADFGILFFALSFIIGLIIGLLVLVLRQILIVFLIIVAPLAIAAYVLPNTKKAFGTWWDWFFKALLMFPIIMAFIAIGRVFALVSLRTGQGKGGEDIVFDLIAIIAYVIPFFLLPYTFKLAGGAIGGLAEAVHSAGKKPRHMLKEKGMEKGMEKQKERLERAKSDKFFKGGNEANLRGRLNRRIAYAANVNKAGKLTQPGMWGTNIRQSLNADTQSEIEKNMQENADYRPWMNNDTWNRAATESHDEASLRSRLTTLGVTGTEQNDAVASIERVRRNMSADAFKQMTAIQTLAGGTATEDAGEAWQLIADASTDSRSMGFLVARGRDALMKSGRVDQGGGSFGATLNTVQGLKDGSITQEEATRAIEDSAIDSSAPGQAVYGKPKSAMHLAEAHSRKIGNLLNNVNDVAAGVAAGTHTEDQLYAAEREAKQAMASAAGVYDAMSQASPQNAREFANGLTGAGVAISSLPPNLRATMALRPDGASSAAGNISIMEGMENLRAHDREFAEMRRDYGSQVAAEAAHAASATAAAPTPGGPPPGGPPPGGPPIGPGGGP